MMYILYNGKLLEKEKRNHKQGYVKVHFILRLATKKARNYRFK